MESESKDSSVSLADLFILDQHACDEKFNFEALSRSTVLHAQDLMVPIKVQLPVTDALAVALHADIFKSNGFKVVAAENEENTFLIKSLPQSKQTTFNVEDFHELVQKVNDHLDFEANDGLGRVGVTNRTQKRESKGTLMHKEILRPKKVYSMLASRACRSSIMIGRVLDHKLMKKVVTNLQTLESPWNCPHGRPTLRFLKKMKNTKSLV